MPLNILLVHSRRASQGIGEPANNANNHPFVSDDGNLALIHNGRIFEFDKLKNDYPIISQCDSEILLRIVEAGQYNKSDFDDLDSHVAQRMIGIRDIFSQIQEGHMAVAIGERWKQVSYLWLFRNQYRSLWVVDLRDTLGQMFFCSTANLWCESLGGTEGVKYLVNKNFLKYPQKKCGISLAMGFLIVIVCLECPE